MLPELTYDAYGTLGGCAEEERFNASLPTAKAFVREIIGFNEPRDAADEDAYLRAVSAGIDVDITYGQSGGIAEGSGGFSIGSYSESGSGSASGSAVSGYETDMRRAIRRELIGSSLLYQGIC